MTTDLPASFSLGGLATLLISTGLGYIGGFLTSRAQARLEYDKWLRARQDEVHRDVRAAVAEVASDLAALAHSVMWFTYNASDGEAPEKEEIQAHNNEIHHLISDLVSAQVRLAALDQKSYQRITPSVSEAIRLSEKVDGALAAVQENPVSGRDAMLKCNSAALEYIKALPGRIANLINA